MTQQQAETTETATEDTTVTNPAESPQTGSESQEGTVPPQDDLSEDTPPADDSTKDDQGQEESPNREAAKYRRQLRTAQKDLEATQEQLTAARRQLAESASGLTHPAGLWAAGTEVDSLFGDDGSLNREALATATQEAVVKLGLRMGGRPPRPNPAQNGPGGVARKITQEDVVLGKVNR